MDTPSDPSAHAAAPGHAVAAPTAAFKRKLRPVLMLVALLFVSYTAWQLAIRWQESPNVNLNLWFLSLSLLPLVLATFLQGRAWLFVIERLAGHRVPRGKALALYFDSQLARYAGKLGLPVVRMAGASAIETTGPLVGASIALEMLSWLAVGGAVGFGLSWGAGTLERLSVLHTWGTPLAFGCSLVLLLALLLLPAQRYPKAAQRLLNGDPRLALIAPQAPVYQFLYWLSWAGHGALLARALGADVNIAIQASGLFPLATVAGFIVLVTPGGLGMREAVLALGLTPTLGASAALVLSILSRASSLLAEVLVWGAARLMLRRGPEA
ncbi:MAG: hypothetical protein SFV15_19180 [Polyangiaceae bacterium]|nr:hypothetical protein [Polyangiaceae bacterium]